MTSALVVPAVSLASTPAWTMSVTPTPNTAPCTTGIGFCSRVNPSAAIRFVVTITNNGKSNIAQLYLTDTITGSPLSITPPTGCNSTGMS